MNVGVVGLGFMGTTHLQAWSRVHGARVTALSSSDPRKRAGDLKGVGGNLSLRLEDLDFSTFHKYATAEELIADPAVDAVDICAPTHLHRHLAELALRAGKHVLVEKPMALTPGDCRSMLSAARANRRVLMVAQVLRYWPDYSEARKLLLDGEIGPPELAVFRRKCGAPGWNPWIQEASHSGGGAFDLLIHDFDFSIHLFGKPDSVQAAGRFDPKAGYDWLEAELIYPEGPCVIVSGGWQPGDYPFSMEFTLTGCNGCLDFRSGSHRLTGFSAGEAPELYSFGEDDGFRAELQAFAEACRDGKAPALCRPEESALAVETALRAVESRARGGKRIRV